MKSSRRERSWRSNARKRRMRQRLSWSKPKGNNASSRRQMSSKKHYVRNKPRTTRPGRRSRRRSRTNLTVNCNSCSSVCKRIVARWSSH
jgi:hypothetical protein